jgi:transcriptional regulator with XRE-family HTH domain
MSSLDTARMRELRESLGLSQATAAERAGLAGKHSWYLIESGRKSDVKLSTLQRIARVLGVESADLLAKARRR